ncbi:AMP-binding protein [Butyricimonas virosa]|uniref:AMP-binding protein n=1 Tax=Butyricimonas virosa TaxID=544645 RepID=UPI003A853165
MIFLYDEDKVYSYDDFLETLYENNEYYPFYQTKDVFLYFVNFVKALISNQPLILIDSDLNPSEIENLNVKRVNEAVVVKLVGNKTMEDVISLVQNSLSEISLFTSGTTGQPKKVIHTISTLTRFVRLGERYRNQIWAYAYNPTHMAGLQVFFQAFENENTLVNVFNKPRDFVYQQIKDKKISHISATPTFYRLLLPCEDVYKSVIRVTLGGEKSDPNLYDFILKIFPNANINNVYASTEAGSLFTAKGEYFKIPMDIRDKIKIEEEELLIHKSLLGNSENFSFVNGFYKSGDLIEWIDEKKGIFRFKSRKNELINVGGYKINPGEVENLMLSIEGVRQVLVYGKSNSVLGNVLCADVQLEEGVTLTELDIRKNLENQLQDFKIPRRIKFVKEIALTRTGKLRRL